MLQGSSNHKASQDSPRSGKVDVKKLAPDTGSGGEWKKVNKKEAESDFRQKRGRYLYLIGHLPAKIDLWHKRNKCHLSVIMTSGTMDMCPILVNNEYKKSDVYLLNMTSHTIEVSFAHIKMTPTTSGLSFICSEWQIQTFLRLVNKQGHT